MAAALANHTIEYCSEYRHSMDDKRRVQIPAKWRSQDGAEVEYTLVRWPHGPQPEACLMVFPPDEWQALVAKVKSMPFVDPKAQALRRLLSRKSVQAALDKAGRICVPEELAKKVGIEREVVLVGLLDCFQIWNPERYNAVSAEDELLFAEAFELLGQDNKERL